MKPLLLIILLSFTIPVIAQTDSPNKKIEIILPDTNFINEQIHKMDSIRNAESMRNMDRNMSSFLSQMKERNRKATQQMWMRFGFAGLFIIIAIISFVRRKKAKAQK